MLNYLEDIDMKRYIKASYRDYRSDNISDLEDAYGEWDKEGAVYYLTHTGGLKLPEELLNFLIMAVEQLPDDE